MARSSTPSRRHDGARVHVHVHVHVHVYVHVHVHVHVHVYVHVHVLPARLLGEFARFVRQVRLLGSLVSQVSLLG